jgi:hypothetical protein
MIKQFVTTITATVPEGLRHADAKAIVQTEDLIAGIEAKLAEIGLTNIAYETSIVLPKPPRAERKPRAAKAAAVASEPAAVPEPASIVEQIGKKHGKAAA